MKLLSFSLLALLVMVASPPLAFADTTDVGKNLGEEVKLWATTLLLGVAGLVAIPVLAKRDINGGLVLALLVMIVGGFAFAPEAVESVIQSLWKSIAG
jgi:cobalamin synthase